MDMAELEIFREVARQGSVTRAARTLQRVQSNVTTRIQQLEEELGVSLFLRDSKRMELSADGERFLLYAEKMLTTAEEAKQALHPATPSGVFRVGSMESTTASRLPKALLRFHKDNPLVKLELTTGPSEPLIQSVLAYKLDCVFVAHSAAGSHRKVRWNDEYPGLDGTYLFPEELRLVAPPGMDKRKLSHGEMGISTIAAFANGCTYRKCAEEWVAEQAEPQRWTILEVSSYHAILACIATGSAIGFLPQSVLDLYREQIPFEVSPYRPVHTWLVRRADYAAPAFEVFLKAVRSLS